MARYRVHVRGALILVVLPPSALVSALRDKIIHRLPSLQLGTAAIADEGLVLHLHKSDGPILDVEDLPSDAVEDPLTEEIYAVIRSEGEWSVLNVSYIRNPVTSS